MHASSFENMERCHARYVRGEWLASREQVHVVDVGGADVNGGYRPIFDAPGTRYRSADLTAGDGVDIVLEDPYRLPLEDGSVDIVVSGQMLEHCEFFWLSFAEMMRVLKPDGFLFLIAPSAGPIHQYPVDCYRFYPDAYRALAKHAGCHLVECWLDERGPWRDLVGVFSKTRAVAPDGVASGPSPAPVDVAPGNQDEEATRGKAHYYESLKQLHASFEPRRYLEIGVRRGGSLALARCPATGIDPAPAVVAALPDSTRLVEVTSDEYFRALRPPFECPDLVFIDGMHLFECVLRDFMHVERISSPSTLVVIDDVFPSHPAQAERTRRTRAWTGDVWKFADCLRGARPDLVLVPLDTAPTGLLLVAGLDPGNRVLWDRYNPIVRQYRADGPPPPAVLRRDGAIDPDDPRIPAIAAILKRARSTGSQRGAIVAGLRALLAAGNDA